MVIYSFVYFWNANIIHALKWKHVYILLLTKYDFMCIPQGEERLRHLSSSSPTSLFSGLLPRYLPFFIKKNILLVAGCHRNFHLYSLHHNERFNLDVGCYPRSHYSHFYDIFLLRCYLPGE